MILKEFQQEITQEFPSNIYLLCSSESFLLYWLFLEIKEFYKEETAFNFDIIDVIEDKFEINKVLTTLNTLPFMSSRRIVILENVQKLTKPELKKLESYFSNPSCTSLFIMFYENKSDKTKEDKLPSLFDFNVIKKLNFNIGEKGVKLWIKEVALRKGLSITNEAVEYLIETVGLDFGILYSEVEKFSVLAKDKTLDIKDIENLVYAGAIYSAFDLINTINSKDAGKFFKVLENLSRNTRDEMLLGAINWKYTKDYNYKQMNKQRFDSICRLLYNADVSLKTSNLCVFEELFLNLSKTVKN